METDTDFILTRELPNSQFHFKPERIVDMDDKYITMDGREAITNQLLSIKVPYEQFISWSMDYPKQMIPFMTEHRRRKTLEAEEEIRKYQNERHN